MSLLDVPVEIVEAILKLALRHTSASPLSILLVSRAIYDVSLPILHANPRMRSQRSLDEFIRDGLTPLLRVPTSVTLNLSGVPRQGLAEALGRVFTRCRPIVSGSTGQSKPIGIDDEGRLMLERLALRCHTRRNDSASHLEEVLQTINPRHFYWAGPDPGTHLSIAITPDAATHLFLAVSSWSRLTYLSLSNISFPIPLVLPSSTSPLLIPPLLPHSLPKLESITISQATALSPTSIAAFLALSGSERLRRVHLIDAYEVSIWGKRLRRTDVEGAAEALSRAAEEDEEIVKEKMARVREVVLCEARLERIIGGERIEGGRRVLD